MYLSLYKFLNCGDAIGFCINCCHTMHMVYTLQQYASVYAHSYHTTTCTYRISFFSTHSTVPEQLRHVCIYVNIEIVISLKIYEGVYLA